MDASKLSDYQLYEISQNQELHDDIRRLASSELNSRNLSADQFQQIVLRHEAIFGKATDEPLEKEFKTLLILFPFFVPIQAIIANKYLAKGQKRKWKDYWFYVSVGFLVWTVAVILFCKFFVFTKSA